MTVSQPGQSRVVRPSCGSPFSDNDLALIIGTGSTAIAGSSATTAGDWDIAAVFGNLLHANAT